MRRFMVPPKNSLAAVISLVTLLLMAVGYGCFVAGCMGAVSDSTSVNAAEAQDHLEQGEDDAARDLTHVAIRDLSASTTRACRSKTVTIGCESSILPHWAGVDRHLSRLPSRERQRNTGLAWVSLQRRHVRLEI
jgi:hypothetical protein